MSPDIANHPSLIISNHVQDICAPFFKKTGINYFCHCRAYKDGSLSLLVNNPNVVRCIFNNNISVSKINKETLFDLLKKNPRKVFCPERESIIKNQEAINKYRAQMNMCREFFNVDNLLEIVEKQEDVCCSYGFAAPREHLGIVSFYLNEQEKIDQFISYFKEQAKELITIMEKNKLTPPRKAGEIITEPHPIESVKTYQPRLKYYPIGNDQKLTACELKNLLYWLKGQSIKEISRNLQRSPKTIEKHIARIKGKMNGITRSDLFEKALALGWVTMANLEQLSKEK